MTASPDESCDDDRIGTLVLLRISWTCKLGQAWYGFTIIDFHA